MRSFLPIALMFSLLGGCDYDLISKTPAIPASNLAMPEGISGNYWALSRDDGLAVQSIEWKADAASRSHFTVGWDGDETVDTAFHLVNLTQTGAFLAISADGDGSQSSYALLLRRDQGILEIRQLQLDGDSPFEEQNLEYVRKVAANHGFSIEVKSESRILIDGPVEGMGIPRLFQDPEFLGALMTGETLFLLPMEAGHVATGSVVELIPQQHLDTLMLAGTPTFVLDQMAQPEGFAGSYPDGKRIRERSDGLFDIAEGGAATTRLGLLTFNADEDIFVTVPYPNEETVEKANEDVVIEESRQLGFLVRNEDGCWTASAIRHRDPLSSTDLAEMRSNLMREAAGDHGIDFDGHLLSGAIDVSQLLALLKDGKFTSGLDVSNDSSADECPLAESVKE